MKDFIIIGGGIAGLSCAYWLEKKNNQVMLIEKEELGHGASGRNAGFLTGGSINYFSRLLEKYGKEKALDIWSFTSQNVALIKKELNLKENIKLTESGTISLFNADEVELIEKAYGILKENNFKVEKVNPIFNYADAFKINTDASFDPKELLTCLGATLSKTEIKLFTPCHEIHKVNDHYEVETESGTFKAKRIIFATNSLLYQFIPELKEIIKPIRAQIASFKVNAGQIGESNYLIPSERIYFRRYHNGVIMGGLRYLDAKTEETIEMELNQVIQNGIQNKIQSFFGENEVVNRWSGIMGFTHDEQPIVGCSATDSNIYYIGGFSGHGNGYAFKLAQKLVDML